MFKLIFAALSVACLLTGLQAPATAQGAGPGTITNCILVVTNPSNALSVALKTQAGADPSAGSPCTISFRNATASTGDYTPVGVTASTSFTTGATGSTFGSSNNVPFRLWIVAINNAGVVELGVSNRSTAARIYPLNEAGMQSTTACSACTTANAAGTIYSTSARSSNAIRVLGYATWETGLTMAGTYATVPNVVQLYNPAVPLPGQPTGNVVSVASGTQTNTTGDGTYQATGLSASIAPLSAANFISVSYGGGFYMGANAKNSKTTVTRGGSAIGLAMVTAYTTSGGSAIVPATGAVIDKPGTTGSTSYGVSIACEASAPCSFPLNNFGSDGGGYLNLVEIQG